MKGVLIVLGTAIAAWVLLAFPAAMLSDEGPSVTLPALLVCLAPNLLAVLVTVLVRKQSERVRTGVIVASFVFRPLIALGLGFGLYVVLPALHGRELSLLLWGALFYVILLGAESYVVSRQVAGSNAGR